MSDYETRRAAERAKEAAGLQRFEAVLQAGADAALWRVVPSPYAGNADMEHMRYWREVETDAGRFGVRLGRDSITASVARAGDHNRGVSVHTSELYNPAAVAPTATSGLTREPLTIARDLHRRVCVPGADDARRLQALLAERMAMRAALLGHVEALKAQGAEVPPHMTLGAGDYYEAKLWVQGFGSIRATAAGRVHVERVTVTVADLPAPRAMVARRSVETLARS